MTAPLRLPGGSFVLPGNRWDLLDGMSPARPPSVSVVIPHFNAQRQLDRLLFALSRQTHPLTQLDVIVADDGSSEPPVVRAPAGLRVRVVGQADAGFRAAAARNLGAATATGEVLCFLDVDTVPEPGYLQALTRLPALAPDALVTGRRRHGDLAAMSDELYERWLGAAGPGPTELTEPQWLTERHERSGNLLRLGPDSYRFVLSAVLGCSRALFNELGGFEETFIHYGGEDWEFAHRALSAAAVLAHVPDAVAWHDGPSWAERGNAESQRRDKNAETQTLTALIPDPAFGGRPWTGRPDVIVEIDTGHDHELAAAAIAVHSVLAAHLDAGIWLRGRHGAQVKAEGFALDPRVTLSPVPAGAAASARVRVDCSQPLRVDVDAWHPLIASVLSGDVGQLVLDTGDGTMTVSATRALARARRWSGTLTQHDLMAELFGRRTLLAAEYGVSAVPRRPDLAHQLAHLRDRTGLLSKP